MKTAMSAVATAVTLMLASCGGGDGGKASTARSTVSAAREASDARAGQKPGRSQGRGESAARSVLTKADLAAVSLSNRDLAEFRIREMYDGSGGTITATARPTACPPVEKVRLGAFAPKPAASVRRYAEATEGDHLGSATSITLAAFARPTPCRSWPSCARR